MIVHESMGFDAVENLGKLPARRLLTAINPGQVVHYMPRGRAMGWNKLRRMPVKAPASPMAASFPVASHF